MKKLLAIGLATCLPTGLAAEDPAAMIQALGTVSVLVLDDSTSAVDMETELLIQQALANVIENRTSFVIAHRLRTAKRADQVLVVDQGRIVQRGTHEQLVNQPGLYQEIYHLQLRDQEEALEGTGSAEAVAS